MANEVAVAAVGFRRVEAAVIDRLLERQRKVVHDRRRPVRAQAADGAGGTAHERVQRLPALLVADAATVPQMTFDPPLVSVDAKASTEVLETMSRFLTRQKWLVREVEIV